MDFVVVEFRDSYKKAYPINQIVEMSIQEHNVISRVEVKKLEEVVGYNINNSYNDELVKKIYTM